MSVAIALVGLGYWGPNLARTFAGIDGVSLKVLCDMRRSEVERVARHYPTARCETDFARVLADPEVDAVVIATPAATHASMVREAIIAGKHVLVEKPLALSVQDGEYLAELAARHRRVLMVGHVFLYNPAVRQIKSYIDEGLIGDILYVYSQRLSLGQVREDVNALWNFAPHDLSILQYWLGSDPSSVFARGFSYINQGIADVVFLTLEYPGGIGANIHISWLDPSKVRRMTIVGSRKMVVYDDASPDAKIAIYDKGVSKTPRATSGVEAVSMPAYESYGEFQLLLRAGDVLIPRVDFAEPLRLECEHFVDSILRGTDPLTDARSAIGVIRVLEAAQQSLDSGILVDTSGTRR
jgi:predicted dehydrogenase